MAGREIGTLFDLEPAQKGDAGTDLSVFVQRLQESERGKQSAKPGTTESGSGDKESGTVGRERDKPHYELMTRPEQFLLERSQSNDKIAETLNSMDIDSSHKQMVVVTSGGWRNPNGTLELYERSDGNNWHSTGQTWDVSLGMTGMGWGRGSLKGDAPAPGPGKNEGDKRSPAGVFELGSSFGYDSTSPAGSKMPYRQATRNDYFVDDPSSPDYNKWVRLPQGENPHDRWNSYETMRMRTDQYKLGLVVNHNMDPVVPGKGSAIFMHIWGRPGGGTVGCTAMSESNMRKLLNWLDPAEKPLLMQVPDQVVPSLRGARVK